MTPGFLNSSFIDTRLPNSECLNSPTPLVLEAFLEKQASRVEAPGCSDFWHEASVPSLQLRPIECSQSRLACSLVGTGPEGYGMVMGMMMGRALALDQVTARNLPGSWDVQAAPGLHVQGTSAWTEGLLVWSISAWA